PKVSQPESRKKPRRQNEVNILKLLARKGEQGMLLQSIADTLGIDSNATKKAIEYLEGKKLIETIQGMGGNKVYLTQVGTNYCGKKGYMQVA
ncbi:MAG: hypothetical protein PVH16_05075, partial [Thioalkalispiraceae bacterium]